MKNVEINSKLNDSLESLPEAIESIELELNKKEQIQTEKQIFCVCSNQHKSAVFFAAATNAIHQFDECWNIVFQSIFVSRQFLFLKMQFLNVKKKK